MTIARTLWNQRIKTRDGLELAADVILPPGSGPFPTVLTRTPYGRARGITNYASRLAERGYAFVTVDVRGRGDSGGDWLPWHKDLDDAFDVVEWIATQPWTTGKVGMIGGSYDALTQWWAAAAQPPHLRCIVPQAVGCVSPGPAPSLNTGIPMLYWLYWMAGVAGRTFQNSAALPWEDSIMHLPLRSVDERLGVANSAWRSYADGKIDSVSADCAIPEEQIAAIDIPVLVTVGWWDDHQTMLAWQALQKAKSAQDCRLLIGAWDHIGNRQPRRVLGGLDMSASVIDTFDYIERFLALHLKGEINEMAGAPRCRIFQTGTQRWEELDEWPSRSACETAFYLASGGKARSLHGDGRLVELSAKDLGSKFDEFTYDPNEFAAREMTARWFDPPLDVRYLFRREDVLVYDTDVMSAPLAISGRVRAVLFVSSDRVDTDMVTYICDVHEDGRTVPLGEPRGGGCRRLSYRQGATQKLLTPHTVVEVEIASVWLHHVILPGHRLRFTVGSNSFPYRARNSGTGTHWAGAAVLVPQTNRVYHCERHRSRLLLPIVPTTDS